MKGKIKGLMVENGVDWFRNVSSPCSIKKDVSFVNMPEKSEVFLVGKLCVKALKAENHLEHLRPEKGQWD